MSYFKRLYQFVNELSLKEEDYIKFLRVFKSKAVECDEIHEKDRDLLMEILSELELDFIANN